MELALEINGSSRTFWVPIDGSNDNAHRDEARFESSLYPEIGARLSLYPGAVFTDNWTAGIGIEGSYHHHLFLRVHNLRRDQEVSSEEYTLSVGLTYRITAGDAEQGLTLWPRVGFGRFSFFLGDEGNDIVLPFVYDHIYMGFNAHIPMGTRHIGIDLGGEYLLVLGIGEYATMAYNKEHSLPSTHGFRVSMGFSGEIAAGLRWRIGFELLGFVSYHNGRGHGWGHEPSTRQDLGGLGITTTAAATDIFYRLIPQLSYRFGWRPDEQGGSEERGEARSWREDSVSSARHDEGDSLGDSDNGGDVWSAGEWW